VELDALRLRFQEIPMMEEEEELRRRGRRGVSVDMLGVRPCPPRALVGGG
jgi:hypothetical protein